MHAHKGRSLGILAGGEVGKSCDKSQVVWVGTDSHVAWCTHFPSEPGFLLPKRPL